MQCCSESDRFDLRSFVPLPPNQRFQREKLSMDWQAPAYLFEYLRDCSFVDFDELLFLSTKSPNGCFRTHLKLVQVAVKLLEAFEEGHKAGRDLRSSHSA